MTEHTTQTPVSAHPSPELGPAPDALISSAIAKIQNAHLPIAIVGMKASRPAAANATRALLKTLGIPFVETYQGAGVLSRELESQYVGRIGLFRNQPGDLLIEHADVLLTIGFDPIEYDPKLWNLQPQQRQIIHVDDMQADIDHFYEPALELVGNISETVKHLAHDSVPF